MKGCTGNMYNTAPVDISIQEPEGNKTEVCYSTAELSDPTHAGDPMNQTPGVSTAGTAPNDSQVIPIDMPDPEPEATTTQQMQHTRDEDEQEKDVVGIDEAELKVAKTATNGTEIRSEEALYPSRPKTATNTELPVIVVNHPHKVKDEIDLPIGNVDPSHMHRHFKLKAAPLKVMKTKMKRI